MRSHVVPSRCVDGRAIGSMCVPSVTTRSDDRIPQTTTMTVLTWSVLLLVLAILYHPGPRSLGRLARVKPLLLGEQRLPHPKILTLPDHPLLHHDITTHIHNCARGDRLTEVVDRRVRPNARERRASRMSLVCNCASGAFLRTMVGGVRCRIALARSAMVGGARCVHTTSTRARALR